MFYFSSTRSFFAHLVAAFVLLSVLFTSQGVGAQTLGGLAFDGIDDFVALNSGLSDQLSEKQRLSVEVRLTFNELTSGGGIFSYRKNSGKSQSKVLELRTSDDGGRNLVVAISNGPENSRTATTTTLQPDREYLVSVVFDGTRPIPADRTQLYIDGIPQPLTGGTNTPGLSPKMPAGSPVYLGRSQDIYSAVTIHELRIWETALTPLTVVANGAAAMAAPFASELTAYYDFNGPNPNARQDPNVLADRQSGAFSGRLTNFDFAAGNSGWVQAMSLPVELMSFEVAAPAAYNRLSWTVASEREFGYYSVERSPSGSADWEELERVYPSGDTEGADKRYTSVDATPPTAAYYRLRMVDLDGTVEFSDVVYQQRQAATGMSVYPNPTHGPVTIELPGEEAISLVLTDMSGRRVWYRELPAGAAGRAGLDPEVAPGVYVLTARSGSSNWNERLVVR